MEFRGRTNGLPLPCGAGLLGALAWFGLDGIGAAEKADMRAQAVDFQQARRPSVHSPLLVLCLRLFLECFLLSPGMVVVRGGHRMATRDLGAVDYRHRPLDGVALGVSFGVTCYCGFSRCTTVLQNHLVWQ